jgi:hypothetical protein
VRKCEERERRVRWRKIKYATLVFSRYGEVCATAMERKSMDASMDEVWKKYWRSGSIVDENGRGRKSMDEIWKYGRYY